MTDVSWFPDWSAHTCALVASGESAAAADVGLLRGRCKVAVVNTSYQLAPWGDVLYSADGHWWIVHKGAPEFSGLRVTQDRGVARSLRIPRIDVMSGQDPAANALRFDPPGHVGNGGNSGFQLLNLVLQFGVRRLLLIGFDFRGEHWHGKHPQGLRNPRPESLAKWAATLDAQAPALARIGARVVNASPDSLLTAFPKLPLAAALAALEAEPVAA